MKKRKQMILALAFALALIILVSIVLIWPLSFSNIISDGAELRIVVVDISNEITYDNGQVNQCTKEFFLYPNSSEFIQMQQILTSYTYHRSIRTFSSNNSILIGDRYYLDLHSGVNLMITGGTNEIKVNNRVFCIGYFGNNTAVTMMDEIKGILDKLEPYWEMNIGVFPAGNTYR